MTATTGDVDPASGAPPHIRSRLALVLDTDDLVDALRIARELKPWFGVADTTCGLAPVHLVKTVPPVVPMTFVSLCAGG